MKFDCIIVGAGPAGITACLYLCRAGYNVALITGREIFGSLGKISSIENYPGVDGINGYDLAIKMYGQLDSFKNLIRYEYVNAIYYSKNNNLIDVKLEDNSHVEGKSLIIAIGGKHKVLGLKGESNFFGKGISFCATCDGPIFKDKNVAVIGGGNTALDFAITLSKYCKEVVIIHRRNELRADKAMIEKIKFLKNVQFKMNSIVTSILHDENFTGLSVKDNNKSFESCMQFEGCFYALGFDKNDLECIKNDDTFNSCNNIFYAGDCIDTKYRQVITACGDGCKVAINCIHYLQGIKE